MHRATADYMITVSGNLTVWTDGSIRRTHPICPGGWAYVVLDKGEEVVRFHGAVLGGTSQRMEMMAVIKGLEHVRELAGDRRVYVFSDSQYTLQGAAYWIHQWPLQSWKTSVGNDVKNQDLWGRIRTLKDSMRVSWHWIPGHKGIEYNELADRLAKQAVEGAVETWRTSRLVT